MKNFIEFINIFKTSCTKPFASGCFTVFNINFNGVLCGRATWAGSVEAYIKDGEAAAREWLRTTGFENIDELNKVLKTTATSWTERV